jgi:SAM-dependent methyltransferase
VTSRKTGENYSKRIIFHINMMTQLCPNDSAGNWHLVFRPYLIICFNKQDFSIEFSLLTWFFGNSRLEGNIPELVDVVSLIFVLSAIHPDKFQQALHSASAILKPGGVLVFRDYGLYDMAQLRFGRGNKIGDNFYVRQDGTR